MNIFKAYYIIIPFLIESVFACAACYGDPSSSAGKGMDMAIITLLGIISPILLLFLWDSFNWTEIKKNKP